MTLVARARRSYSAWRLSFRIFILAANLCFLIIAAARAQTTQPVLFAVSTANHQYSASTFLRDDIAGTLTLLNTSAPFKNPCTPQAIDAKGRFLFGICGDGLALYTFDTPSGTVAEIAASPFNASTGNTGTLIVAESTGQYVYLIKSATPNQAAQTLYLDTFQIDATTPALIPLGSQTLPVAGALVASAGDPNLHGMALLLNQNTTGASYPSAILYTITFDPGTGAANLDPEGGQRIGDTARSMTISPTGNFLAIGFGQSAGTLNVYEITSGAFTLSSPVSYPLGVELPTVSFPDFIFFNPNGELLYVQAPPANYTNGGLPFLIFDTATLLQLPSSPLALSQADFVYYLRDSQGPFAYTPNSSNGANGISVYFIDPGTGQASQPAQIDAPFYPQLAVSPVLAPFGPSGGQGIGGPALTPGVASLTFASTVVAHQAGPRNITLTSTGQEAVSLTSIAVTGANAADFLETDTCMTAPVLKPNAACTISITYAPSSVGSSQASLFITDNAPGSPQQIFLAGTAVASPQPAPVLTLNPATALNFPGTIQQGTPSLAQSIIATNSGSATLQFSTVALSGLNATDFSVSSNTCVGPLAPNATCTISLIFTPLAAGVRTTTLLITDNAANSPQSITVSGTGTSTAPGTPTIAGTTTASVSAGQPAQFNLTASAGPNFTGTLTFACSGVPFMATCTTPTSVSIINGAPVPFTVSITTTAAAAGTMPSPLAPSFPAFPSARAFAAFFLVLLSALCVLQLAANRRHFTTAHSPRPFRTLLAACLLAAILASGIACGGASGSSTPQRQTDPAPTTPSAAATATPLLQPAGGTISTGYPTVTVTDATSSASIHFTTDGSTPTASSPLYSAPFTVNTSATTIQAIATAPSYSASAVATASYKFQTPTGSFPITLTPTATATGSAKQTQLSPITLILTVK